MSLKFDSRQIVADFRRYPEEWDEVKGHLQEAERRGIKRGFIARRGVKMWLETVILPTVKKASK